MTEDEEMDDYLGRREIIALYHIDHNMITAPEVDLEGLETWDLIWWTPSLTERGRKLLERRKDELAQVG